MAPICDLISAPRHDYFEINHSKLIKRGTKGNIQKKRRKARKGVGVLPYI